jgi:hypothetical protein
MKEQIMPQAFVKATATKTEAKLRSDVKVVAKTETAEIKARIDMSADVAGAGLCPECRKPMELSHANGIPVMVCDTHRIAIPVPDQQAPGEVTNE